MVFLRKKVQRQRLKRRPPAGTDGSQVAVEQDTYGTVEEKQDLFFKTFGPPAGTRRWEWKIRVPLSRTLMSAAATRRRRAAAPAFFQSFLAAGRHNTPCRGFNRHSVAEATALRRRDAAPITPRLFLAAGRHTPPFSGLHRQTQIPNIVEAVATLRRREAAPRSTETTYRVPARGLPRPSLYWTIWVYRLACNTDLHSILHPIAPDPDMPVTHKLRLVPRTANAPRRRIDFPRTMSQDAGGQINLPSESTRYKPGVQDSIFGHPANGSSTASVVSDRKIDPGNSFPESPNPKKSSRGVYPGLHISALIRLPANTACPPLEVEWGVGSGLNPGLINPYHCLPDMEALHFCAEAALKCKLKNFESIRELESPPSKVRQNVRPSAARHLSDFESAYDVLAISRYRGRCQTGTTFHAGGKHPFPSSSSSSSTLSTCCPMEPLTNGNGNRCPLFGNQLVVNDGLFDNDLRSVWGPYAAVFLRLTTALRTAESRNRKGGYGSAVWPYAIYKEFRVHAVLHNGPTPQVCLPVLLDRLDSISATLLIRHGVRRSL
ncbi:hypothetical protein B0H11DRAFT_1918645 [Mycena galericulata]|nr:hypothetical protein B0H11DRAFT_1918645 [Mycena galericulata]